MNDLNILLAHQYHNHNRRPCCCVANYSSLLRDRKVGDPKWVATKGWLAKFFVKISCERKKNLAIFDADYTRLTIPKFTSPQKIRNQSSMSVKYDLICCLLWAT